jgi:hypothetical protein
MLRRLKTAVVSDEEKPARRVGWDQEGERKRTAVARLLEGDFRCRLCVEQAEEGHMSSDDPVRPTGERLSPEELARRSALRPNPNAPGAALFDAVDRNDFARVRELTAHGADINVPDPRTPFFDGATVLMSAANRGSTAMVQLLLSDGADVDARSASGWTALMRACNAGRFDCALYSWMLVLIRASETTRGTPHTDESREMTQGCCSSSETAAPTCYNHSVAVIDL